MDKSVLMIGDDTGFMVNATINALKKENYNVQVVAPDVTLISRLLVKPMVWILYLEDIDEDIRSVLTYCKDAIGENGLYFYMIGNPGDLSEAYHTLPETSLTKAFERPVNNKDLIDELNYAVGRGKKSTSDKKILVVDDDPTMVRMLSNLLSDKYKVYMATSGMNAITILAKNKIDLVLLDYEMPVVSGAQVLEMIRSEPTSKDTPVIMLTAKNDKESVMKVLELKPEKYLLKTMPPERWLTEIDDYFRLHE